MEIDQNDLAVRFLLGKVTDDERSDIERKFFQSTSAFENILIAENSLTDLYVCNRLSPEDRLLFEERLMINPSQRKRAAFAEALVSYASRIAIDEIGQSSRASRFPMPTWILSPRPLFSSALMAAAIIVLGGITLWWASNDWRPTGDELGQVPVASPIETSSPGKLIRTQPAVKSPEPDPTITASAEDIRKQTPTSARQNTPDKPRRRERSLGSIVTIILPLGSTRDGGTVETFAIPKNASGVNLQLKLDGEEFSKYFAVIETVDGQQVWRGNVHGSTRKSNATTVAFTVHSSRLRTGDYIVTLKGSARGEPLQTIGEYSFTLTRP